MTMGQSTSTKQLPESHTGHNFSCSRRSISWWSRKRNVILLAHWGWVCGSHCNCLLGFRGDLVILACHTAGGYSELSMLSCRNENSMENTWMKCTHIQSQFIYDWQWQCYIIYCFTRNNFSYAFTKALKNDIFFWSTEISLVSENQLILKSGFVRLVRFMLLVVLWWAFVFWWIMCSLVGMLCITTTRLVCWSAWRHRK